MIKKILFLLINFLCIPFGIWAQQNSDAKPIKSYRPNAYWVNPRYDHYLKLGSFLYFENSTRFTNKSIPAIGNSFPFDNVYQMYFMLGYEHKATDHWYLGLSERVWLFPAQINNYYTRFNFSHRGKISSIRFIKEAAFDYILVPQSNNPNIVNQNIGRVSVLLSLVKDFKIGDDKLFLIASYRPYIIFDLVQDSYSAYEKRKIDKTEMRFELGYFVKEKFMISLFGLRDTDYFGYYNAGSNSNRINIITPSFGVGLNYVFRAPEDYIPGFPIK